MRLLLALAVLASLMLIGCSDPNADLSKEASPSATGPKVKSNGPAQLKVSMDKLQKVGSGDGVMQMDTKGK